MDDDALLLLVERDDGSFQVNHFGCAPVDALSYMEDHECLSHFSANHVYTLVYGGCGKEFHERWAPCCVPSQGITYKFLKMEKIGNLLHFQKPVKKSF